MAQTNCFWVGKCSIQHLMNSRHVSKMTEGRHTEMTLALKEFSEEKKWKMEVLGGKLW